METTVLSFVRGRVCVPCPLLFVERGVGCLAFVRLVRWQCSPLRTVCIAGVYLLRAHVYHLHIPFVTPTLS